MYETGDRVVFLIEGELFGLANGVILVELALVDVLRHAHRHLKRARSLHKPVTLWA